MTSETWDADEAAVTATEAGEAAEEERGVWRYGVTDWEAAHHEPFDVALAQESPEPEPEQGETDDEWAEVDREERFPGRLVADEAVADDDYALAVEDPDDYAAEELAVHVEEP